VNNAIQWTITPLSEVIADARAIENADHRLGFVHAHLKHRDEAIEDLHETVAELSRELDRLRELAAMYGCHTAGPSVTQMACKARFQRNESATPESVQEFVNTAWDRVPVGGGA
jgi:hypothetical protein